MMISQPEGRRATRPESAGSRTWRLDLCYEGTAFKGWARQPGERTVQGELERVLGTLLRVPVRLSVAGRTDAGVHALAQVASFVSDVAVDARRLRLSLDALLPQDIAVLSLERAPDGFEARAAASRTYRYRLLVSPPRPVFERAFVWWRHTQVDRAALQAAADMLLGGHDFAALTPSARLYRSCRRRVLAARWHDPGLQEAGLASAAAGRELWFEITAGSFLHNMVRVAVGSMVDVAEGRMTLEQFAAALAGGERKRMGQTAPARGLALTAVSYEDECDHREMSKPVSTA
jgi:tRNA pseudouridine38-40 synthase